MRKTLPFLFAGCLIGVGSLFGPQSSARGEPSDKPADHDQTAAAAQPSGDAEKAEKDFADYQAFKAPPLDRSKIRDKDYVESFKAKMKEHFKERARRAKEFADKYPDNSHTSKLLLQRWQALAQLDEYQPVLEETAKALKAHPDTPDKDEILMLRAEVSLRPDGDLAAATDAVEAFIKADPKDERAPQLLMALSDMQGDVAKQKEILQRIVHEYPDTRMIEMVHGAMHRLDRVGQPFELSFTDAINGKEVSMKDLKGKVVVVDFWATWCGPCVAEMPHNKELYAKYKDQGVQFVGVSLDAPEGDGGLKELKEFVEKNEIGWPQYYQGNGWESQFSKSWDVMAIPCVFILDKQGRLYSPSARGHLEKLIPELLKGGGAEQTGKTEEKGEK